MGFRRTMIVCFSCFGLFEKRRLGLICWLIWVNYSLGLWVVFEGFKEDLFLDVEQELEERNLQKINAPMVS